MWNEQYQEWLAKSASAPVKAAVGPATGPGSLGGIPQQRQAAAARPLAAASAAPSPQGVSQAGRGTIPPPAGTSDRRVPRQPPASDD
jgi:hypothetical protein